MKNLFPGQYRPSDEDLENLWKDATFVFDTNVLLNLYSYPESLRDIFLSVLDKISTRSWIPYHVALEFHRNRFSRIKQANTPLLTLRDRIRTTSEELETEIKDIEFEKRNTGVDNLEERLQSVKIATAQLAEALDKACDRLPKIGLDDPIAQRLAELFEKSVGLPPKDQAALDSLIQDGSDRYEKKIPPGFKDAKDKKDIKYYDREITYQAMFGDLIIWRQTIDHIRENSIKNVIYITGDRKEDWWNILDKKTLGPLPDLVREFTEKSNVDRFWMYTADQFLRYAETYLSVKEVTPETIEQVREISAQNEEDSKFPHYWSKSVGHTELADPTNDRGNMIFDFNPRVKNRLPHSEVEQVFADWARRNHGAAELIHHSFPDIIIPTAEGPIGYEILSSRAGLGGMLKRIVEVANRSRSLSFEISIAVILLDDVDDRTIDNLLNKAAILLEKTRVRNVIVGDLSMSTYKVRKTLRMPIE